MGVDAAFLVAAKWKRHVAIASAVAFALWCITLPSRYRDAPGTSADEDRAPQIVRGLDLRARDVQKITLVPCAYEHFALIAAFGMPERVDIAAVSPKDAAAHRPDASCPALREN